MSEARFRRWPLYVLLVVLAFGVFAGALMTWHHESQLYGDGGELLGCSESATTSCDEVNTSSWSELFGVPLATWAIPTYLTFAVLAVLALRGRRTAASLLFVGGAGATAFSGFLLVIALTQVGFLCAWCMRLYGVNVAIFVLAWIAARPARPDRSTVFRALAIFAAAALITIIVQRIYRGQLIGTPTTTASPATPGTVEHDPATPAPARQIEVRTEEGRAATLVIAPTDAWKGNPRAKVTLVEFADFQCGHCRNVSSMLMQVFEKYGDRVLFVFKHFPMDPECNPGVQTLRHKLGCPAARTAVCVREQGKFWAFHDLVYGNQKDLTVAALRTHAERAGVDLAKLDTCVADPRSLELVRANGELGKTLGLHATPRIFIGNALYRGGRSTEAITRAVEAALAK